MDLDEGCHWLQLQADDYSAWVSVQTLKRHPDSLLAGLADTAVQHGREHLRLDMSPDVAQEVIAALRLGDGYAPPADDRLVSAVQHQLDYLGIPQPARLPPRLPQSQQYLFVHSYSCEDVAQLGKDKGLLLYNSLAGWSTLDQETGDPRPTDMDPQWFYASCTLPAASTGVHQDLMLVAGPVSSYTMEANTRKCHTVPSCKGATGPCVSVQGKAFMLGRHSSAPVSCFDPCVNCWFQSAMMPEGGMYDFAAVSPPGCGMIVICGGVDSSTGRHRDGIAMYDSRCRGWSSSPSGVTLPKASRGLAAAALDGCRLLVFGGSGGPGAYLLDLRMWQLQPAGQLSRQRQHIAGVCMSGSVLALGGEGEHEEYMDIVQVYDPRSNSWSTAGHLPLPMSHMAVAEADVTMALRAEP